MRVLYIDGVGPLGGSSRSLFEAVRGFPAGEVEPLFVLQRGTAMRFYGQIARDIIATQGLSRFDNTRASHYRGLRWLVLLRELFHFPYTVHALYKARRRWGRVDLIHVNEVTEIIPGLIARRLFKAPLVVHVRSPQRVDSRSIRTRWLSGVLARKAAAIVAINQNTRLTLPPELDVDVIQNSFTPKRADNPDAHFMARLDALRPDTFKVGFVGNLHYAKGVFDLLEAARILRDSGRKDIDFVLVGSATMSQKGLRAWLLARAGLAQDVQAELREKIRAYSLEDTVHMLGETTDIQRAYERMGVVCFPSHFDAPGRPVFEAAFSAVPSIVSVSKPQADTLVHGETGLAIAAHDPPGLAAAILHFADRPAEAKRMGANALALARNNFVPAANALKLLAVYRRAVAASSHPPGG